MTYWFNKHRAVLSGFLIVLLSFGWLNGAWALCTASLCPMEQASQPCAGETHNSGPIQAASMADCGPSLQADCASLPAFVASTQGLQDHATPTPVILQNFLPLSILLLYDAARFSHHATLSHTSISLHLQLGVLLI